jgi:hypothetical protein
MDGSPNPKADEIAMDELRQPTESELRSSEVKAARRVDVETARKMIDDFRHRLVGRKHSDSTDLIREDRDR